MARPSKRTPEVDRRIEQAIKVGASYKDACLAAGICEDTLAAWRRKYSDFSEMLTRAEAEGKVGWLAKIEKAGNEGDWRALAWKLERRYPQEYGKSVMEHQGPGGKGLTFTLVLDRPTGGDDGGS